MVKFESLKGVEYLTKFTMKNYWKVEIQYQTLFYEIPQLYL